MNTRSWVLVIILACLPLLVRGQVTPESSIRTVETSDVVSLTARGRELTIRSLGYDAERRPYLGHFMQRAVSEWNRLPNNILRDQMQKDVVNDLAQLLKQGLAAQNKISGITGAPELQFRVGVGVSAGVSVNLGVGTSVPVYGAGYRDAMVRHEASRNPLMRTVREPEMVARQFFDLLANDPEAVNALLPLAKTLFTVHPLNYDPNEVLKKDERLRFEESERARALEIRGLRDEISRLSNERRQRNRSEDAELQSKLSAAIQRHQRLTDEMRGKFRSEYKAHLNALIQSVDAHRWSDGNFASSPLNRAGLLLVEAAEQARLANIARTYGALEDWTKAVATVATLIDPQTGATIGTAGDLMLSAVSLYFSPSFGALNTFVGLYSSIVGQLLGGAVDVAAERHAQVMTALQGLDQKLAQIKLDLDSGFATVHEQIAGVNRQVLSIHDAVNDLSLYQRGQAAITASSLGRIESALISAEQKLDRRKRQEWIEDREAANQDVSVKIYEGARLEVMHSPRPPQELKSIASSAIAAYIIHADHGSTQSIHLGPVATAPILLPSGEIASEGAFSLVVEGLDERGAGNNLRLLTTALGVSPQRALRNPEEYLRGAVSALLIPSYWPADYPRLSSEQRKILREAGQDIISVQGELVSEKRLLTLLKGHNLAFQRVLATTREWANSETTRVQLGLVNIVDVLRGFDQFKPVESNAFQNEVNPIKIPFDTERLATEAPQFCFPPKNHLLGKSECGNAVRK